jgi:hypothetical protein
MSSWPDNDVSFILFLSPHHPMPSLALTADGKMNRANCLVKEYEPNNPFQQWRSYLNSSILNVGSGLVLDVRGGQLRDGDRLQLFAHHGKENQQFIYHSATQTIQIGQFVLGMKEENQKCYVRIENYSSSYNQMWDLIIVDYVQSYLDHLV